VKKEFGHSGLYKRWSKGIPVPSMASQFQESGGERLGVCQVAIKALIRNRELGGEIVDFVFLDLWWHCGSGRRPGLNIP
jgi:hypothetical protein